MSGGNKIKGINEKIALCASALVLVLALCSASTNAKSGLTTVMSTELSTASTQNLWSDASYWAAETLLKAEADKLIPDTLIGTDMTARITRAEFAAVAVRLYERLSGKTAPTAPSGTFSDTADENVLKAYAISAVNGMGGGVFEPDAPLTREQAAVMLTNVYKAVFWEGWNRENDSVYTSHTLDIKGTTSFSDDEKISDWAKDSVYFMYKNNIISGMGNNVFAPRNTTDVEAVSGYGNATREQALIISERMYEEAPNIKDGVGIVTDGRFPDYTIISPDDISLPYPKPDAKYFVKKYRELHCVGMTESDYAAYKDELADDGWICISDRSIYCNYIKGNSMIIITDQTFYEEPLEGEIRISYSAGYTGPARAGAVSKDDAIGIIQKYISASLDDWLSGQPVKYVLELDIPDAFEKMNVQAFTAISGEGYGNLGTFMICEGSVLPADLGDICVADIDKDGNFELISIYGWGSGIWRINLDVYKFGVPPGSGSPTGEIYLAYMNCWVPEKGFAELTVQRVNDTDVKLFSIERKSYEEFSLTTDHGLLRVEGDILRPSNTGDFPFTELGIETSKPIPDEAVIVSDGYLLYVHDIDKDEYCKTGERIMKKYLEKYDLTYSLLWRREYPFMKDIDRGSRVTITPAADDSFVRKPVCRNHVISQ